MTPMCSLGLIITKQFPLRFSLFAEIPQCDDSMGDCAYGGKCVTGPNGYKSCLCPASCPVCTSLKSLSLFVVLTITFEDAILYL